MQGLSMPVLFIFLRPQNTSPLRSKSVQVTLSGTIQAKTEWEL